MILQPTGAVAVGVLASSDHFRPGPCTDESGLMRAGMLPGYQLDIKGFIRINLDIFVGYVNGFYLNNQRRSQVEILWICQESLGYLVDILAIISILDNRLDIYIDRIIYIITDM